MSNKVANNSDSKTYKEKWVKRFEFFNIYGAPNSSSYKLALKSAPEDKLIYLNFTALFVGPFYLFVLGLWKKNLSLMLIGTIINAVAFFALPPVFTIIGKVAIGVMYAVTTNYAYYLKEVKGEQGWNPFKGIMTSPDIG